MPSFSNTPTYLLAILILVRITFLLGIAWGFHFGLRRFNPRWTVALWRSVSVSIIAIVGCITIIPGWGPQFQPFGVNSSVPLTQTVTNNLPSKSEKTDRERRVNNNQNSNSNLDTAQSDSIEIHQDSKFAKPTFSFPSPGIGEWVSIGVSLYCIVVLIGLIRLVIQIHRLNKLLSRSAPAPSVVQSLADKLVAELELRKSPQVILSTECEIPFAAGILSNRVVLPSGYIDSFSHSELRLILAHEFCHFKGHDLQWAILLNLLKIIIWIHPLVWRIPNAHRYACDLRCDQLASGGNVSEYVSILARCTINCLHINRCSSAMAFARKPEVLRRIQKVGTKISDTELSFRSKTLAGLFLISGVAIVGTFGLNRYATRFWMPSLNADKQMQITVLGPDDHPVNGAVIAINGLRTITHSTDGPTPYTQSTTYRTKEDGTVVLTYPLYAEEEMKTGGLSLSIQHPDYVERRNVSVGINRTIPVKLETGRRLELTVVDAKTKQPLNEGVFVSLIGLGGSIPYPWESINGSFRSPLVSASVKALQVVVERDNSSLHFSKVIDLELENITDDQVGIIEAFPSRSVRGKISDVVPRPVKSGNVHVCAVSWIGDNKNYKYTYWRDFANVEIDGSFVFNSIPQDANLYFWADCDGWISATLPPEKLLPFWGPFGNETSLQRSSEYLIMAQPFSSERQDITIEMEPSAECQFQIVDKFGTPINDAKIIIMPPVSMSIGSGVFRSPKVRSFELMKLDTVKRWKWYDIEEEKMRADGNAPYEAKTDSHGLATIKYLPMKKRTWIWIQHDKYELPVTKYFRREAEVDLSNGSIRANITLQPIGTQVLGR